MRRHRLLAAGVFVMFMVVADIALADGRSDAGDGDGNACSKTAVVLRQACYIDLGVNFRETSANCLNMSDPADRADCYADAKQDWVDAAEECGAVYDERQALCDEVGQTPYEPAFGEDQADTFVDPLQIGNGVPPNRYFPLVPGTVRVFKDDPATTDSPQTITVTVTPDTKLIEGITCVVVRDVVVEDGAVIEDTDDWYAQDMQGNVWYCGESSQSLQTFPGDDPQQPELVAIDGSWKAGDEAGSKAGIVMAVDPQVGETRRLELSWGEAEDAATILAVNADESTPGAQCHGECLQTLDFTPLDAGGGLEHKFYAPGIGVILEIDLETGVRTELQP